MNGLSAHVTPSTYGFRLGEGDSNHGQEEERQRDGKITHLPPRLLRRSRYYADFRDVGGGREALKAPGDARTTTDPLIAEKLATDRLAELMGQKRDKVFGRKPVTKLAEFASYQLVAKAKSGNYSATWFADSERMLKIAIEHFGADRDLSTISVSDVQGYANTLAARPTKRMKKDSMPRTLGPAAVRHYLNVLSALYGRAQSEERVELGYTPWRA